MIEHFKSRKFTMAIISFALGLLLYFSTIIVAILDRELAEFLLGMFNTFMPYIAGVAAALLGVQGFVDWKHNGGSNVMMNTLAQLTKKKEEIKIEQSQKLEKDVSYDKNVQIELSENFKDDPSYAPIAWIETFPEE